MRRPTYSTPPGAAAARSTDTPQYQTTTTTWGGNRDDGWQGYRDHQRSNSNNTSANNHGHWASWDSSKPTWEDRHPSSSSAAQKNHYNQSTPKKSNEYDHIRSRDESSDGEDFGIHSGKHYGSVDLWKQVHAARRSLDPNPRV